MGCLTKVTERFTSSLFHYREKRTRLAELILGSLKDYVFPSPMDPVLIIILKS